MQEVFIEGDNLLLVDREIIRIKDKWDGVVIIPKALIEQYIEEYLKDNFEMSDDGWVRKKATSCN